MRSSYLCFLTASPPTRSGYWGCVTRPGDNHYFGARSLRSPPNSLHVIVFVFFDYWLCWCPSVRARSRATQLRCPCTYLIGSLYPPMIPQGGLSIHGTPPRAADYTLRISIETIIWINSYSCNVHKHYAWILRRVISAYKYAVNWHVPEFHRAQTCA